MVKIDIKELETEINKNLEIKALFSRDFLNVFSLIEKLKISVENNQSDELIEKLQQDFIKYDEKNKNIIEEWHKKFIDSEKSVSDIKEKIKIITDDFLKELSLTKSNFNSNIKLLQDENTVSLDRFEIIDKNFLKFEEDLKKYANNIYEYGSSFSILKDGSLIGQTGSLNFRAGGGITLSVVGSGNGIDVVISDSAGSNINNEVVSGSGTTFTLANTPKLGSEHIFGLGQRLTGGGVDYTISGAVITTVNSWVAGQILCDYQI